MTLVGVACLIIWVWMRWVVLSRRPKQTVPVWVFRYKERGKLMEFVVAETTEPKALAKYMQARLDPSKIVQSFASTEPLCG